MVHRWAEGFRAWVGARVTGLELHTRKGKIIYTFAWWMDTTNTLPTFPAQVEVVESFAHTQVDVD